MQALTEPQKLWIAALRSGEYLQGQGQLKSGGKYCCLGVGCEVAIKAGIKLRASVDECSDATYYDGEDKLAPPAVVKWLGLRNCVGRIAAKPHLKFANLVGANDDFRWTFDQIADLLERHPEYVFRQQEETNGVQD